MSALLAPRPWQPSWGKLPSCKQNSFQLLALLMSLLVSHETISSFTSDSVRRTQDMLSGSASFQMHPRNPFRTLLELFLEALLPASSCSQPLPSSSTSPPSPSAYPSPSLLLLPPPLFSYSSPFSYLSPLPRDACQFFKPLLHSLSHRIHVTNLSGLWGGHYLLLSVRKKQAQLWTKSMGVKKKKRKRLPHSALTDHETGTFCS